MVNKQPQEACIPAGGRLTCTWIGEVSILSAAAIIRDCLLECTLGSGEWDLRFLSSSPADFHVALYHGENLAGSAKQPVLKAEVTIRQQAPFVLIEVVWSQPSIQLTNSKAKAIQELIWQRIIQSLSQLSRSAKALSSK